MSKQEDLERLDTEVRNTMLTMMKKKDYKALTDLTVVVNYLAKNNEVAEKHVSSVEEDIETRLREAEARRKGKAKG